ncbi:lysine N(6)-hydroxylase/L-ornithine N(5)-oxygenase family protein [Phytoactinopolyspora limicola]|uniref:lysine N(6)-hydroxylase/L-ornithine N(5)-oxygenase family protein n=1 Tax=Phytoactinopolyspora limicola TaxID=2715536 RepID=UPI001409A210|nr:SidA/IucD/PvdA family monooxygenase [Phytoactinopolyspora limicola]
MESVDVVGVGIGPFNLGLAALLEPVGDVRAVFLEARPSFAWHPGLMLPGATLQVPFLADLVTLADPTSRFSFLNYLHQRNRLYRFYFYEHFHVPRQEYDAYARWVAESLPSCRFGHHVTNVEPAGDGTCIVRTASGLGNEPAVEYRARSVVFGVGSRPAVPAVAQPHLGDEMFHAADYLSLREKVAGAAAVTVVGSGQSAGEVIVDLLETGLRTGQQVDWFTRGPGFLPMEYSKLGLEHFTPDYIDHFRGLPADVRDGVRAGQDLLYKGLSAETSERIYDLLYTTTIDSDDDPPVTYAARSELVAVEPAPVAGRRWRLTWRHRDEHTVFTRDTDIVVLATGYEPTPLPVPDGVVSTDERGRPAVGADYRLQLGDGRPSTLFAQNAELHTHGVGAPDLGLGAHRNTVIVNALAGREVYPVRRRTTFQRFGTAGLDAGPVAPPGGTTARP